jgi:dihydropteroate synthase
MGIVNVTPDSFSDGGLSLDPAIAIERAITLAAEGAAVIDVGGESSRPGAESVSVQEELRRVLPVVEAVASRKGVALSVDTTKPETARQALAAGAHVINDIRALEEPGMLDVVAESDAGVVLMHMAGTPATMQVNPTYVNVVEEVYDYLARRLAAVVAAGIAPPRVALDPGIGFGKTAAHNLALLKNLPRFASLGCAVLVGTSRKRFLGSITGKSTEGRLAASLVSAVAALQSGATIVRVHDVAATADAIRVWEAQHGWSE